MIFARRNIEIDKSKCDEGANRRMTAGEVLGNRNTKYEELVKTRPYTIYTATAIRSETAEKLTDHGQTDRLTD